MKLELNGKRALITGSNVGIGEAISKTLAIEGVSVAVHGLDKDKAIRVTREIEEEGGKAFGVVGDLSTDGGAAYIARQALESLGNIDILINNAGAYKNKSGLDISSVLFQLGKQLDMSKKSTSSKSETDWSRLDFMTDEEIDLSDCPEITPEQFAKA